MLTRQSMPAPSESRGCSCSQASLGEVRGAGSVAVNEASAMPTPSPASRPNWVRVEAQSGPRPRSRLWTSSYRPLPLQAPHSLRCPLAHLLLTPVLGSLHHWPAALRFLLSAAASPSPSTKPSQSPHPAASRSQPTSKQPKQKPRRDRRRPHKRNPEGRTQKPPPNPGLAAPRESPVSSVQVGSIWPQAPVKSKHSSWTGGAGPPSHPSTQKASGRLSEMAPRWSGSWRPTRPTCCSRRTIR